MAKLAKASRKITRDTRGKTPRSRGKPYQFLFDYGMVIARSDDVYPERTFIGQPPSCIIDEAQNLTPHEAKTVVSRMGEGSKVILLGDPAQVDSMFHRCDV